MFKNVNRIFRCTLFFVLLCSVLMATAFGQVPDAEDYIAEGREHIAERTVAGIRDAYRVLDDGINAVGTDNKELVFLHALTRASMVLVREDGGDINSMLELAASFGIDFVDEFKRCDDISFEARLNEFGVYEVPDDAPDNDAIRSILDNATIPELDSILAALDLITDSPTFSIVFTTAETGLENDMEVDYGEVLLLRALIKAVKGLLTLESAYELLEEAEIDPLLDRAYGRVFSVNDDLLGPHPDFLRLINGGEGLTQLATARDILLEGIDDYLYAVDYIKNETDDQEDDFLYIDPDPNRVMATDNIETALTTLRDSVVANGPGSYMWRTLREYNLVDPCLLVYELELYFDATGFFGREGTFVVPDGAGIVDGGGNPIDPLWIVKDFERNSVDFLVMLEAAEPRGNVDGMIVGKLSTDSSTITDASFEYWGDIAGGTISVLSGGLATTPTVSNRHVDLTGLYDGTVSIRDMLPEFGPWNEPLPGTVGSGLGGGDDENAEIGIMPGMTQDEWREIGDLLPSGCVDIPEAYGIEIDGVIEADWWSAEVVPVFVDATDEAERNEYAGSCYRGFLDTYELYLAHDANDNLYVAITFFDPYDSSPTECQDIAEIELEFAYPGRYDPLTIQIYVGDEGTDVYVCYLGECLDIYDVAIGHGTNTVELMVRASDIPVPLGGRMISLNTSLWWEAGAGGGWHITGGEDNDTALKICTIDGSSQLTSVSGAVTYPAYAGGPVYVQAYSEAEDVRGSLVASTMLAGPGDYILEGIGVGWTGYIRAMAPFGGEVTAFNFNSPKAIGAKVGGGHGLAVPAGGVAGVDLVIGITRTVLDGYATIQDAIDASIDGDTVVVPVGMYTGVGNYNLDFHGKAITLRGEGDFGECVIDCQENGRGFCFHNGETGASVVENITVQNGYGDYEWITWQGGWGDEIGIAGAVLCDDSSPRFIGCVFESCSADWGGAVGCIDESSPTLIDCIFAGNSGIYGSGGGMCNLMGSNPLLDGCLFMSNQTIGYEDSGNGGGMYNNDSSPLVKDCIFQDNVAEWGGGAVYNTSDGHATFERCRFVRNNAIRGGCIYNSAIGTVSFVNCVVEWNNSWQGGGIYTEYSGKTRLINSTLTGNAATGAGGGLCCDFEAKVDVYNCILWGNEAADGNSIALTGFGDVDISETICTVSHSDIAGGFDDIYYDGYGDPNDINLVLSWDGVSVINEDPRFFVSGGLTDPGTPNDPCDDVWIDGDYRLLEGSPCIDTGENSYIAGYDIDIDKQERISNGTVNMGAYESTVPVATHYNLTVDIVGDGSVAIDPCDLIYAAGTRVELEAIADPGYVFASWSGTDDDSSTALTNTVTMNSDKIVTVVFVEDTIYNLTVVVVGGGSVVVDPCGFNYAAGTPVALEAIADSGYEFASWSGTDNDGSTALTNTVTMNGDKIVTVVFVEDTPPPPPPTYYTLTVDVVGNGSVSPSGGSYAVNTHVTLQATPDTGYRVQSWSGAQNGGNADTNIVVMNSDKKVTVVFEQVTYSLTASVVGGHGTVTPTSGAYTPGSEVWLHATANTSYGIASWTGTDNDPGIGLSDNVVTMDGNRSVVVRFEPLTGSLRVNIIPQLADDAGARWRVNGGASHAGGDVISGLSVLGSYTVEFLPVDNWQAPDSMVVSVSADVTSEVSGAYVQLSGPIVTTGSLRVVLSSLEGVIDPSAGWGLSGSGQWYSGGYTLDGIEPGSYGVVFKNVIGWTSPLTQSVLIQAGDTTVASGVYIEHKPEQPEPVGSLMVTIEPEEIAAIAIWQLDGGVWYGSGDEVGNVTVGSHTVTFEAVDSSEWLTPGVATVEVYNGRLAMVVGRYLRFSDIMYVSTSGSDATGNGSLNNPLGTIQEAIDRVNEDGTVMVLPGTYSGVGNCDLDFGRRKGSSGARSITVRSRDGAATCVIDCQGSETKLRRGFYFHNGENAEAVVDGFTITGGYATVGGGILCSDGSNPTIRNCIVTANTSQYSGAGIRCEAGSPTIVDCTITYNTATMTGGGVFCSLGSNPSFSGCSIIGNTSQGCGGGLYCSEDSRPTLQNCVIANNASNSNGGGLYCATNSRATLDNCTVTNNIANIGGAIRCYHSDPTVTNSIIWHNTSRYADEQIGNQGGVPVFDYCDIEGCNGSGQAWNAFIGSDAGGNLDISPEFIDSDLGNYHLLGISPCVDAGDPCVACIEPLPSGNRVNQGAYGNTPEATLTIDSDSDGLTDPTETRWGLNPYDVDTDGDGLNDYLEVSLDGDPCKYAPYDLASGIGSELNALVADTDGDGLGDYDEVAYDSDSMSYLPYDIATATGSDLNALSNDSDGDGMSDRYETLHDGLDPLDPSDATEDPDDDGYDNLAESKAFSDPFDPASYPPSFTYDFEIARVRYGVLEATGKGLARLVIEPPADKVLAGVTVRWPDGSDIALPSRIPAIYDENDFLGQGDILLSDIEAHFVAGIYTLELAFGDGSAESTSFEHWYSVYPAFTDAIAPLDEASGFDAADGSFSWTGQATRLYASNADSGAIMLSADVGAGSSPFAVGQGVLAPEQQYVLGLVNANGLAPAMTSVTLVRFDTHDTTTIVYVDCDATGTDDGSSWANAYPYLQDALIGAAADTEIRVAHGVYNVDSGIAFIPEANKRATTFELKEGVAVKGGYAGFGENDPDAHDMHVYETVLDGTLSSGEQNVYHVVTGANNAVLDGFVITGGDAHFDDDENSAHNYGGGLYCEGTSPMVNNCTFRSNGAVYGGGVYCYNGADPVISNCVIESSSATYGGGVFIAESSPTIVNSLVIANYADDGGAIYAGDGSVEIVNCTIVGNRAAYFAGGVLGWQSSIIIGNSIIWDNIAEHGSALALSDGAHITISYSDIQNGSSGIYRESGSSLTWAVGNIDQSPRFVTAGSWDKDNVWVAGDYNLRDVSPCIDSGDNNLITGYDTDLTGNTRIYNNTVVDMGAYEYQGVRFVPNTTPLMISSFRVSACAQKGYGSMTVSGSLDVDSQVADGADTLSVRIGPFSKTIDIVGDGVKRTRKGFNYIGHETDGSTLVLNINLSTGSFTVNAKNIKLSGLSEPVEIEIGIGDYYCAAGEVPASAINGPLPMQLLSGYANALRVDKYTFKPGNGDDNDYLMVKGAIAARYDNTDIANEDVIVRWGDFVVTLPAENLRRVGQKKLFKFKKTAGTQSNIAAASIDLEKCTFKIVIKNSDIGDQGSNVLFGIAFTDFNETVNVQ